MQKPVGRPDPQHHPQVAESSTHVDLCELSAVALARGYRSRTFTPVEVVKSLLERIQVFEPTLNAFTQIFADAALDQANRATQAFRQGRECGPLYGIPIAVKDNIDVGGEVTRLSSNATIHDPAATRDAEVIRRLRTNGALILGKTTLYEFGFGEPFDIPAERQVQNPRSLGHQAGGSSSGSAVAVAAGMSPIAVGTDTGGSVRHPASLCGVLGYRPSRGFIPHSGLFRTSIDLDEIGLLARVPEDIAPFIDLFFCSNEHTTRKDHFGDRGPVVGVARNKFYDFGSDEGRRAWSLSISEVGQIADLVDVIVPLAEESNRAADILMTVDAEMYLEARKGRSRGFGAPLVERCAAAGTITSVEYAKARTTMVSLQAKWQTMFQQIDFLLLPGNAAPAPRIGESKLFMMARSTECAT